MILPYHILSAMLSPFIALYFLIVCLFSKNKKLSIGQHFGWMPPPEKTSPDQKTLWLHALSMGEVIAARPVLEQIRKTLPEINIVVTVTTDSGFEGAHQHLTMADQILFHPLDCLPFTWAALTRIRPDIFILTDTGFWPGLLDLLRRKQIPAILFNGRISKKSLRRYKSLGAFTGEVLSTFSLLCMQNIQGKEAVLSLGVDPARVQVLGDPKYDALQLVPPGRRQKQRKNLRLRKDAPVWIAGSTHLGEEEIILSVYQNLKTHDADLVLLLAPRRLERVGEIARLLEDRQIPFIERSKISPTGPFSEDVIVLDTMGELAALYAIADVAFVGNSLLPPGGGHSLIEPIAHGLVALHGPFIENIRHVSEPFEKYGLAVRVETIGEMQETLEKLLRNKDQRAQLAKQAARLIQENQGASRQMAGLILEILAHQTPSP